MWTRGGRTRSSLCWMLSRAMDHPPFCLEQFPRSLHTTNICVLQTQRFMYPNQHVFVHNHIPQPLFQRHLSPPHSALHQIDDQTMELSPAKIVRYSSQSA